MSADVSLTGWDEVEATAPVPGVRKQVLVTGSSTIVRYTYAPGSVFPPHLHDDEQVTIVHSGEIEFTCGAGERALLVAVGPGGILVIPAGVPHAARVLGDVDVVTDNYFATPVRASLTLLEEG